MSNPATAPTDPASQAAQRPTAPLTSFTELLGLDEDTGTVCTPDGYCS